MKRTIGEMSAGDWAAATEDYGLRTEHMGATSEVYGGGPGLDRCTCGCGQGENGWTDLVLRFEAGERGD